MAHFAQIVNETVIQVIAVDNNDILDEQGNESESVGIQFCKDLLNGEWVQTSYNGNFRKNYAGIGFAYDEARDAFIAHRPWDSWILNVETCQWEAPIPYPTDLADNETAVWDEDTGVWIKKTIGA